MLVFVEGGNPRTQRKTLNTWEESTTINSIHIWHKARLVGGEGSHRYTIPAPQSLINYHLLAQVVQKTDNAIHRINHYPTDSMAWFVQTYPLDSDLSSG